MLTSLIENITRLKVSSGRSNSQIGFFIEVCSELQLCKEFLPLQYPRQKEVAGYVGHPELFECDQLL